MRLLMRANDVLRERGVQHILDAGRVAGSGPRMGAVYRRLGALLRSRGVSYTGWRVSNGYNSGCCHSYRWWRQCCCGIGGGAMQANATGNASKLAANDARIAYLMQGDAQLAPYRSAGEQALGQEHVIIGGGWGGYQDQMRAGFRTDPGYEFMLQQGLRGTNATQSAAHMFDSGATHKADIAFAEGLANQQYNQMRAGSITTSTSSTRCRVSGRTARCRQPPTPAPPPRTWAISR